jgi:hypothetical protein
MLSFLFVALAATSSKAYSLTFSNTTQTSSFSYSSSYSYVISKSTYTKTHKPPYSHPVPEPTSILGSLVALVAGVVLKKSVGHD